MLFLKRGKTYHKVPHADIVYMMADGNYLELHTADHRFVVRKSIQKQLDQMNDKSFIQVHRAYAVNLAQLKEMRSTELVIGESPIPLSKSPKAAPIRPF